MADINCPECNNLIKDIHDEFILNPGASVLIQCDGCCTWLEVEQEMSYSVGIASDYSPYDSSQPTCESLICEGLGDERVCGELAVAIVDADTTNQFYVCDSCAKSCYQTRLTWLVWRRP